MLSILDASFNPTYPLAIPLFASDSFNDSAAAIATLTGLAESAVLSTFDKLKSALVNTTVPVWPFTETTPATDDPDVKYVSADQEVVPSPIFNFFVSISKPNSPELKVGLT